MNPWDEWKDEQVSRLRRQARENWLGEVGMTVDEIAAFKRAVQLQMEAEIKRRWVELEIDTSKFDETGTSYKEHVPRSIEPGMTAGEFERAYRGE